MPILASRGAASAQGFGQRQGARKYNADFMVVSGGGSGGSSGIGGGGGAGGIRSATSQELTAGKTYTITVGAGGVNSSGGNQGVVSSIIGTGISFSSSGGGAGATISTSNPRYPNQTLSLIHI